MTFIPVFFNYKQIWGIGYFKFEKNVILDYSEGSVGIEIKINLDHVEDIRCRGVVRVQTISSGNVQVHGISHLQYELYAADRRSSFANAFINPPVQSWRREFIVSVYEDDNVTCTGIAEVNFSIGGLEQMSILNFDMGYVVPMSVAEIYFVYDLPFIWIDFFYFVFLFVVGYCLYKKYRYIKFQQDYTEEMKKKDRIFFNYLEKDARTEKAEKKLD